MVLRRILLAAVLASASACLKVAADAPAYIIVTTDGTRIEAMAAPIQKGSSVQFRAHPAGTLSSYPKDLVDWPATEAANRAVQVVVPPTPTPTQSLSRLAAGAKVGEAKVTAAGTMAWQGKKVTIGDGGSRFGEESVAEYLEATGLAANFSGCPRERAVVYGAVKNVSAKKLRNLRALVLVGDPRTGQKNEQIQTMDPANIMPGEKAEIFLYISCSWMQSYSQAVFILGDVAGRAEEIARPDGTNPLFRKTPEIPRSAEPAKMKSLTPPAPPR